MNINDFFANAEPCNEAVTDIAQGVNNGGSPLNYSAG